MGKKKVKVLNRKTWRSYLPLGNAFVHDHIVIGRFLDNFENVLKFALAQFHVILLE